MPVPDSFTIAPDFTRCEYCNKAYADIPENMHRIIVEKNGDRRMFIACVRCIERAQKDKGYEDYMTLKTFTERLGRPMQPKKKK